MCSNTQSWSQSFVSFMCAIYYNTLRRCLQLYDSTCSRLLIIPDRSQGRNTKVVADNADLFILASVHQPASTLVWPINSCLTNHSDVNKDWTCKDKDNDKDQDKDKDFTYCYLLQVVAKPTIAIKQQQWTQSENSQHMTVKPITPNK